MQFFALNTPAFSCRCDKSPAAEPQPAPCRQLSMHSELFQLFFWIFCFLFWKYSARIFNHFLVFAYTSPIYIILCLMFRICCSLVLGCRKGIVFYTHWIPGRPGRPTMPRRHGKFCPFWSVAYGQSRTQTPFGQTCSRDCRYTPIRGKIYLPSARHSGPAGAEYKSQ